MPPVLRRALRPARRLVGRSVRAFVGSVPFEVFRRRPGYHYVPDLYGRSAYKDIDILRLPVFGDLAGDAVAGGRTLLYYDKLYTVFQAIQNLSRLSGTAHRMVMADVGAYRGGGGYFMAACAEALGVQSVTLHCFDTFAGHQQDDIQPDLEPSQEAGRAMGRYHDVSAHEVARYLSRFPGSVVHAGRFQETAAEVGDDHFHLAHIDINLYEPTSFALSFFDQRLVANGVLIADDYGSLTNPGVRRAVNEFLESHPGYLRFHLLTNQCVLVKTPSDDRDPAPGRENGGR